MDFRNLNSTGTLKTTETFEVKPKYIMCDEMTKSQLGFRAS